MSVLFFAHKMSTKPLVSLCMSTYLRFELFPKSFRGLLDQSYSPLEIIVLVNGGHPEPIRVINAAADPRVRCISTPEPLEMVQAWNRVVREVRGKYFLFCSDDDVLQLGAIEQQVELLERHPHVGFCHADFRFIDDDGKVVGEWISHEGKFTKRGLDEWERYIIRTGACMQTVVVRTDLWRQVGGWEEDAGNPADNSLYLKLLKLADVGHIAHIACHYRLRTLRPDSWEKKLRNVQEFYTLSQKHLANPPNGNAGRVRRLQRRLSRRLTLTSASLLREADTATQRKIYLEWARATIWRQSLIGRCCSLAAAFHADWIPAALADGIGLFRATGKRVLTTIRPPVGKVTGN